ncbi:ion channel [Brevibacterium sp. NPDC059310]|uniref:ion channel n=1 Tax=Brevibacterium sp. NPDC059310 TaxID=3346802 RepID=UPI00367305A2
MNAPSSDGRPSRRPSRQQLMSSPGLRALSLIVGPLAVLALYFTVPLASSEMGAIERLLATAAALSVLAFALLRLRRTDTNLPLLVLSFVLVAATFSAVFFVVATNNPHEFDGIDTRVDALYFTLTTMTTTGYGDIVATGQLSRILVSAVFVFDLVFLGLFASELSRIVSRRQAGPADHP